MELRGLFDIDIIGFAVLRRVCAVARHLSVLDGKSRRRRRTRRRGWPEVVEIRLS